MPDGDILYGNLNKRFNNAFKMICEGAGSDTCSREILKQMKGMLKAKQTSIVSFARAVAYLITDEFCKSQGNTLNYLKLALEIRRLAQNDGITKVRDKAVMEEAARSYLHDLRYNQSDLFTQVSPTQLLTAYLKVLYNSEFKGKLPCEPLEGPYPISPDVLENRLNAIEEHLFPELDTWAKNAEKAGDFQKLKMPPFKNKKPIDLDEDLLCQAL